MTKSFQAASGTDRAGGNDRLILFALWLLVFSASSQIMIVTPMLPQIGRELDVAEQVQGTLVSAYALMVGVFALVIGPISDKIGRRRILLLGSGAMTLALVAHGAATDYWSLLFVRACAGAAGGMLSGSAVSYVGDYFPNERRGWAMGWVMSSTSLGQIAGLPLGIILADSFGFRAPFLMFAVTMALTFLLVWRCVPQPDVERATAKITVAGALKTYWLLLHRSDVRAGAAAFALMFISLAFFIVFLPKWLVSEFGATQKQIASLFLVGGIANAVTGPIAGRLSDRVGRKVLILGSCLGLAVLIPSVTFVTDSFWIAYPIFFVTMVLVAARMSPFQALLSGLARGNERGSLMSLVISLGQVGFAIGGTFAGFAYTYYGYRSNTYLGGIAVLLMAVLVWRYLPEPRGDTVDKDDETFDEGDDVSLAQPARKRDERFAPSSITSEG